MVLSSVAMILNIGLLTAEALTVETHEREPTSNEEPSPDNDEIIALDFIPTPNDVGGFNDIGG